MKTQTTCTRTRALIAASALITLSGTAMAGIPDPMPQGTHVSSRFVQAAPGFVSDSGDLDMSAPLGPAIKDASRSFRDSVITVNTVADYGTLTSNIDFSGPLSSTSGERFVQGFSEAGFNDDTIVLTAPGFNPGDLVTISATYELNIDLVMGFTSAPDGPGFGFQTYAYDFALDIAGNSFAADGEFANSGAGVVLNSGQNAPGTVTVDIQVPVGQAFAMSARLNSAFYASAISSDFEASFSTIGENEHFRFLGFGDLPADGRIDTALGNYSTPPAPAPASVLALLGAATLAPRRRRSSP